MNTNQYPVNSSTNIQYTPTRRHTIYAVITITQPTKTTAQTTTEFEQTIRNIFSILFN